MAVSQTLNVYLKLKQDNQVNELIKEFNQTLDQHKVFAQYQITPENQQHPPHVTLYQARFQDSKIPLITHQIETLSQHQKHISLLTLEFTIDGGNSVILSIFNDSELQAISNKAVGALAHLRDKTAPIPTWIAQDGERQVLFTLYGSPNVLDYFHPHFAVFAASHVYADDSIRLHNQLQQIISKFIINHKSMVRVNAYAIGLGISNAQGQIVRELKTFNLE